MKLKEVCDWFADRPIHFCTLCFCLTACVFFMSSCAAKHSENYYKYRIETSKAVFGTDR